MSTEKDKYQQPYEGNGRLTWDYIRKGFEVAERIRKQYPKLTPEQREAEIQRLLEEDKVSSRHSKDF